MDPFRLLASLAGAFDKQGYCTVAPGWPGDGDTVAETRSHPERLGDVGVEAVTDSYARVLDRLDKPAIVVGHSFGGLIAQKLLDRGWPRRPCASHPLPSKASERCR